MAGRGSADRRLLWLRRSGPTSWSASMAPTGIAWDPLAHLSLTTTAMGGAARLVDQVAHRYAGGRWFATGGGGYAVYRVVPRVWALTWLAAAHRPVPERLPDGWWVRWEGDAARWDDSPMPESFEDQLTAGGRGRGVRRGSAGEANGRPCKNRHGAGLAGRRRTPGMVAARRPLLKSHRVAPRRRQKRRRPAGEATPRPRPRARLRP